MNVICSNHGPDNKSGQHSGLCWSGQGITIHGTAPAGLMFQATTGGNDCASTFVTRGSKARKGFFVVSCLPTSL
jgi:hypothetical protein